VPAHADDGDTIASGSAPLFWAQVVGNGGLLVAVVPIARELGPSGRGTVAFITVTAIIAATLARLGVTEATTVFCARRPAQRGALLSNLLISVSVAAFVAAVVVCGTLELVPRLRPPGIDDAKLAVLAGAMFASGLADAGYMFVLGCSRFRLHALVTATAAWLYAGTMWLLAVTGEITVIHATLIWVITQAAKAGVLLIASARAEGLARPDTRLLRESIAFGVRAWIGTLSTAFNERLDQILVALLASEAVLGIYATAVNAFDVLLYLAAAAATAMVPLVARADPALRTGRVLAAFRAVTLVTTLGIALAAALGPELIRIVFGEGFHDSTAPFLWLLPGALGFAALAIFSSALVGSSAPGRSSAGPLVSLVLGTALDFVLVPPLGASGAAIAATAGLLSGGGVSLVLYRRLSAFRLRELVVPEPGDSALLRAIAEPLRGRSAR
jgi:O-antigen/teichoic acid export membrane protein